MNFELEGYLRVASIAKAIVTVAIEGRGQRGSEDVAWGTNLTMHHCQSGHVLQYPWQHAHICQRALGYVCTSIL